MIALEVLPVFAVFLTIMGEYLVRIKKARLEPEKAKAGRKGNAKRSRNNCASAQLLLQQNVVEFRQACQMFLVECPFCPLRPFS